jgi:hypothetical protein
MGDGCHEKQQAGAAGYSQEGTRIFEQGRVPRHNPRSVETEIYFSRLTNLLERRCNAAKPCSECILIELVPGDSSDKKIACRYIPFNERGETIDSFYRSVTQRELEEALRSRSGRS